MLSDSFVSNFQNQHPMDPPINLPRCCFTRSIFLLDHQTHWQHGSHWRIDPGSHRPICLRSHGMTWYLKGWIKATWEGKPLKTDRPSSPAKDHTKSHLPLPLLRMNLTLSWTGIRKGKANLCWFHDIHFKYIITANGDQEVCLNSYLFQLGDVLLAWNTTKTTTNSSLWESPNLMRSRRTVKAKSVAAKFKRPWNCFSCNCRQVPRITRTWKSQLSRIQVIQVESKSSTGQLSQKASAEVRAICRQWRSCHKGKWWKMSTFFALEAQLKAA